MLLTGVTLFGLSVVIGILDAMGVIIGAGPLVNILLFASMPLLVLAIVPMEHHEHHRPLGGFGHLHRHVLH